MKISVAIFLFFAIGTMLFFIPQLPGAMTSISAKHGRVINHDSGEGVGEATVLVEGVIASSGFWASNGGCTFAQIATTDANGNFDLPSQFSKFEMGIPGTDSEQWWRLFVSKSGFVGADTEVPLTMDSAGGFGSSIRIWDSRYEQASWRAFSVEVAPIQLKRLDLTFEQDVAMFWYQGYGQAETCKNADESVRSFIQDERHAFYLSQENFVCHGPPSATTDAVTVGKLSLLAGNSRKFHAELTKVAPSYMGKDRSDPYQYRFADLCSALKAGE